MDGKLVLKIVYTDSYRTIAFDNDATVAQAMQILKQKLNLTDSNAVSNPANGLFVHSDADPSRGIFLADDALLRNCNVTAKSHIEFKSKVRALKVTNIGHDAIKTAMVDETQPLNRSLSMFCMLFGIDDTSEYSLQVQRARDTKHVWLDVDKSLVELGLGGEAVIIVRKKFFVTDSFIDVHRPSALHMLYLECKFAIVSGQYVTTLEQALMFAAWQLQIKDKDYDPLVHVAGFLNLSECLPAKFSSQQFVEEDVYKAHRKLKGLDVDELKLRYVKSCLALPTYGTTCRLVRETSVGTNLYDHDLLLGVNHDALICMHPETKDTISRTPLLDLSSFANKNRFLTCQFAGGKTREFMLESEEDAALFASLISGYSEFKRNRRREIFAQSLFARTAPSASIAPQTPRAHGRMASLNMNFNIDQSTAAAPTPVSAPAASRSGTVSWAASVRQPVPLVPVLKFKHAPPITASFSLPGVKLEVIRQY